MKLTTLLLISICLLSLQCKNCNRNDDCPSGVNIKLKLESKQPPYIYELQEEYINITGFKNTGSVYMSNFRIEANTINLISNPAVNKILVQYKEKTSDTLFIENFTTNDECCGATVQDFNIMVKDTVLCESCAGQTAPVNVY